MGAATPKRRIADADFVKAARARQRDGELEVDDNIALVSRTDDDDEEGAYVQCWMWVSNEEAEAVRG